MRGVKVSGFAALLMMAAAVPGFSQTVSPMTGSTGTAPPAAPQLTPPAPLASPGKRVPRAPRRTTMQQRYDAANTTHDGKLTLEQAKAGRMVYVARNFAAIDTGQKGYVTMDDIRAYGRAQRAAKKEAAGK